MVGTAHDMEIKRNKEKMLQPCLDYRNMLKPNKKSWDSLRASDTGWVTVSAPLTSTHGVQLEIHGIHWELLQKQGKGSEGPGFYCCWLFCLSACHLLEKMFYCVTQPTLELRYMAQASLRLSLLLSLPSRAWITGMGYLLCLAWVSEAQYPSRLCVPINLGSSKSQTVDSMLPQLVGSSQPMGMWWPCVEDCKYCVCGTGCQSDALNCQGQMTRSGTPMN